MFLLPSPLNKLEHPLIDRHGIKMYVKRDDLIHPEVSGNKWRKLKYNFQHVMENKYSEIVTFGGAYSNHIAATAAAADHFGYRSIGIIRGDELNKNSNTTLRQAHSHGMEFSFTTRNDYRKLKVDFQPLRKLFPKAYIVPEGGTNALAIKGASEIIQEINIDFDCIITALGTGGTMAGLIKGLKGEKKVLGVSALKGEFVQTEFVKMLNSHGITYSNYDLSRSYHFGGFGKTSKQLINFMNEMNEELNVLFDPIYTGKALFCVWKMIANGEFDDQTLVFLHTGGLQGIVGFNQKNIQKIHI